MKRGLLFVVSAPSGAGKTTLLKRLLAGLPGLAFSVSHTTRPPRPSERDGVDYHFVERDRFEVMQRQGEFLEWAEVHGNLYGTSRASVARQLEGGGDVLLDIDVQGAALVRGQSALPAVALFIAPPSWEELERRLTGRGTESEESVRVRLANAAREMAAADQYDYLIVNDQVESAVDVLRSIIIAERCRHRRSAAGEPLDLPLSPPKHDQLA